MAAIVFPYLPADGAALDVDKWNADVKSTAAGASLLGEMNGRLNNANLAAGQKISARVVKPGEGFTLGFDGEGVTRVFYDDTFRQVAPFTEGEWLVVPGCAHRVYVPWTPTGVSFNVGGFCTNLRMRETTNSNPAVAVYGGPDMYIRLRCNGVIQAHTRRAFPFTWYPANNPGTADALVAREQVLTHSFDLNHTSTTAVAGWQSVRLEVLVPRTKGIENIIPLYRTAAASAADHYIRHRIRFGVRRSLIVAM